MKRKKPSLEIITMIFAGCLIGTLATLYAIDSDLLYPEEINFADPAGDSLIGSYYIGTGARGAIVLSGFGSDATAMRNVVGELKSIGFHVFTFDFSGQGKSPGTLTFDNAALPRLAEQVLTAKEEFKTLSGLTDGEIIFVGHSMGARVAIEAETLDRSPIRGVVAMGASINLVTNVQSEFFTGTSDLDRFLLVPAISMQQIHQWISSLSRENGTMFSR